MLVDNVLVDLSKVIMFSAVSCVMFFHNMDGSETSNGGETTHSTRWNSFNPEKKMQTDTTTLGMLIEIWCPQELVCSLQHA